VCYTESEDGLHFVKPELGLHEINGSKANNVVLPGPVGGCSVWIDPHAPPGHRYKTQAKVYPSRQFHMHSSLDGFISADASCEGGELITPPLLFEGETLELNLDTSAGGSVRVELLDQDGKPIEQFTAAEATQLNGNSVRMPVSWGENRDVSKLAGTPVKIRFIMRDCKLYAFRFKQ